MQSNQKNNFAVGELIGSYYDERNHRGYKVYKIYNEEYQNVGYQIAECPENENCIERITTIPSGMAAWLARMLVK